MVNLMELENFVTKAQQKESNKLTFYTELNDFVTEIEDCYRERALKLNETVIAYGSGKIFKHDKGGYKFNLTSPDDISSYWSESLFAIDLGICHTVKLNDTKDGFHFFLLDTNLTYVFVLHDYNFYVNSANPLTYPRILEIVRHQKIFVPLQKIFFRNRIYMKKRENTIGFTLNLQNTSY